MALVIVCGAECGIAAQGLASSANRHWNTVAGAPAIDTGVYRSGAKSFRFTGNATYPYLRRVCAASRTVGYFRAYFRTDDATPSSQAILVYMDAAAGSDASLELRTDGKLQMYIGGGASVTTAGALSSDTWYGIEMQFQVAANPRTVDWRIWDATNGWVDQTEVTASEAASTISTINFGEYFTGPTSAWNVYFDDILIGEGTTVDEDYDTAASKGGKVLRYRPTADGTHSAFTTGDFRYNGSSNIANTATDVYSYVDDDDQTSISDYISQSVSGAGKYVEVTFADEGTETSPRAVGVVSTHHSSSTATNEMHLRVSDDGSTWTNVWGNWSSDGQDISDTTAHHLYKVLTTKPSGGAWTQSAVNGMRAQWGNSDDVSPVPYIDSVSLEVEWTESAPVAGLTDPMGAFGFFGV